MPELATRLPTPETALSLCAGISGNGGLAAIGEIQDMKTAVEKLKGMPGLKIETARRVEIEFQ